MLLAIMTFFTGWPRLKWVITDSKYLTKPSKDWQPHIPTANTDTAYIEVQLRFCVVTQSQGFHPIYRNMIFSAYLHVKFLYANVLAMLLPCADRISENHIHKCS